MNHSYTFRETEYLKRFKVIFLDFDGVMTDNAVYVDNEGNESVRCSKWDSWALHTAKNCGYRFIVVSLEEGRHVSARANKLGLEWYLGVSDKEEFVNNWCTVNNVSCGDAAFIGNDIADIKAMKLVSFSACPADSHPETKKAANIILNNTGGNGAVREFCDRFLEPVSAECCDNAD